MGTRTAIFKEVEDNHYIGIYVQFDGYIESTGEILLNYYQDNDKFLDVILNKKPLSVIGKNPVVIEDSNLSFDESMALRDENGINEYCKTYTRDDSETEYFKADSLECIRNFEYLTFNENDEIQGFMLNDKFIAYHGSDNNGYLYLQDKNKKWFVSYNDGDTMSDFMPIEEVLKKKAM